MKFDVTYYDFDRNENTMKDGHHLDVDADNAAGAVRAAIGRLADISPDYDSITEATAENEDGTTVAAYRIDSGEWEVHTYDFNGDDLSFSAFNA